MDEAAKTRALRDQDFERKFFQGRVLDIGAGADLVLPTAVPFDKAHGDANHIRDYLTDEHFDCVHSSHCLEHMHDPPAALSQWWSLVKPGGYMVLVVPDEELYEQGYWPSLYNHDHKASFRLKKASSEMPRSFDIYELFNQLPGCEILAAERQDQGYVYSALRKPHPARRRVIQAMNAIKLRLVGVLQALRLPSYRVSRWLGLIEGWLGKPVDQTMGEAVAQIQIVARKLPA